VKNLLVQQGLVKALYGKTKKLEKITNDEWEELNMKAVSIIRLLLADEIMYDVIDEKSTVVILVESREKIYVQVPCEQAASKAKIVWALDDKVLGSEAAHQYLQVDH
jgi:hypothetical protein